MFTNELKMFLILQDWVKKTVHEVGTHSGKEKFLGAANSKKGHADSLLRHKKTNDLIS